MWVSEVNSVTKSPFNFKIPNCLPEPEENQTIDFIFIARKRFPVKADRK
jgi:hypothetical protein